MTDKNLGLLISPPRPSDYILGAVSKIDIKREIHDWDIYLPAVEKQYSNLADFLICTTMSGPDHSLATQLNYLLFTNQLSDEALNFFHNEGYIVDGLFSLSARFNAKLNGTDKTKGQYLNVAADCLRRDGFLPESDWPTYEDMTWNEFYKEVPVNLVAKAKKALWFINIQYQWILKESIPAGLKIAPVQIASKTCPGWNVDNPVQKCAGDDLNHATLIYRQNSAGDWLDLDHYIPFKKILAKDYNLPLNLQYIVSVKPLTLRNGMFGDNVLQLQKDMNKLGYNLKEDGYFGPKTEKAVRDFQRSKIGLDVDGVAGPKTLARIAELVK